ncbi:hypothetical protein SprV_0100227500 [Sparganum proliferum]
MGLPAVSKTHAYDYEAWMAPYGKIKGMYIYPRELVIEFYEEISAVTAAHHESGSIFQGHIVCVSVMQPRHQNTLGELIEWIDPHFLNKGLLDTQHIRTDLGHTISTSTDPVESGDCQSNACQILLKRIMAESQFLTVSQLLAVLEIVQTQLSLLSHAHTEPWLSKEARKVLHMVRVLDRRRRRNPAIYIQNRYRAKLDRARILVEECKATWLGKIDKELQECDKSLSEVASQQGPSTS